MCLLKNKIYVKVDRIHEYVTCDAKENYSEFIIIHSRFVTFKTLINTSWNLHINMSMSHAWFHRNISQTIKQNSISMSQNCNRQRLYNFHFFRFMGLLLNQNRFFPVNCTWGIISKNKIKFFTRNFIVQLVRTVICVHAVRFISKVIRGWHLSNWPELIAGKV